MRGTLRGAEFGGFVTAGFVTSWEDGVLGASALRTDTAGPPGQPMAAVPTWAVVGSAVGCCVWE